MSRLWYLLLCSIFPRNMQADDSFYACYFIVVLEDSFLIKETYTESMSNDVQ